MVKFLASALNLPSQFSFRADRTPNNMHKHWLMTFIGRKTREMEVMLHSFCWSVCFYTIDDIFLEWFNRLESSHLKIHQQVHNGCKKVVQFYGISVLKFHRTPFFCWSTLLWNFWNSHLKHGANITDPTAVLTLEWSKFGEAVQVQNRYAEAMISWICVRKVELDSDNVEVGFMGDFHVW